MAAIIGNSLMKSHNSQAMYAPYKICYNSNFTREFFLFHFDNFVNLSITFFIKLFFYFFIKA